MLIPGFALRLPCNDTPVCCQTFVDGRTVRLLDLFLGKFTESCGDRILVTSLKEHHINRRIFGLILFQGIIDPVFSGIPLKRLDVLGCDMRQSLFSAHLPSFLWYAHKKSPFSVLLLPA